MNLNFKYVKDILPVIHFSEYEECRSDDVLCYDGESYFIAYYTIGCFCEPEDMAGVIGEWRTSDSESWWDVTKYIIAWSTRPKFEISV